MEDEEILRGLLKEKLIKGRYDVLAVGDGEEGMKVLTEYAPDLILLDMMMPKMDGFQVLEKMQAEDLIRSFPVIVISNSGQPVEIDKALEMGIVDYIIKVDFDPVEVVEKVDAFFATVKSSTDEQQGEEEEEEEEDGGLEAEVADLVKKREEASRGIKILLVEDDDFLRGICELKLKKEGFSVVISADGLDALKKIQEEDFDLVLLDVVLPSMDGFEILENVKKNPAKANIPVIMLTNMGQESEVKRGFELGAEDYIVKAHFTVGEIIEKMNEIIARRNIEGDKKI